MRRSRRESGIPKAASARPVFAAARLEASLIFASIASSRAFLRPHRYSAFAVRRCFFAMPKRPPSSPLLFLGVIGTHRKIELLP